MVSVMYQCITNSRTLSHGLENSQTHKLSCTHELSLSCGLTRSSSPFTHYHSAVGASPIVVNISHSSMSPFFLSTLLSLHGRIAWEGCNICVTFPRHTLRLEGPACSQHYNITAHLMTPFNNFPPGY